MTELNKTAYEIEKDKLIYDSKHPVDVANVEVTLPGTAAGDIERGQLLDAADGVYTIHDENGEPSAIVAEPTSYAEDDTSIVATVYTSGSFRQSEVIASPKITAAHIDVLRCKGIYLK